MSNTPFEVPAELRDVAQRSVDQARKAFEGFVTAAQRTAEVVDSTGSTLRANAKSVHSQAMQYAEQNVGAAFDLAQKLVHAKDPMEAFSLQSEYLKSQLANLQSQAKEIGAAIQSSAAPRAE